MGKGLFFSFFIAIPFQHFYRMSIISSKLLRYIYLPSFLNSKLENEIRYQQKLKLDYSYEFSCLFFSDNKNRKAAVSPDWHHQVAD